jgi:Tfp pilus assembly protein PilO
MTRRYAAAGAIAVVVVLLFYLFLLKPKFAQITDVRGQIEEARSQTRSLQLRLSQLRAAAQDAQETADKLEQFKRLLPEAPNLPTLIRDLQEDATRAGMDLLSIAPSPPAALANASGIDTINVNLVVTGGFFRLESFLTQLENPKRRVLEIQSISIAPQTDPVTGLTSLSSTINFRMYVVETGAKLTGAAARPVTTGTPRPTATGTGTASPTPRTTTTP